MQKQIVLTEEEYDECRIALDRIEQLIVQAHNMNRPPYDRLEMQLWGNYRAIRDVICPGYPENTYEKWY